LPLPFAGGTNAISAKQGGPLLPPAQSGQQPVSRLLEGGTLEDYDAVRPRPAQPPGVSLVFLDGDLLALIAFPCFFFDVPASCICGANNSIVSERN